MIRFPKYDSDDEKPYVEPPPPADVLLPEARTLDAGVAKFLELANLNWPKQKGDFSLVRFDLKNIQMLRMTLGLVFMEMLEVDNSYAGPESGA